MLATALGESARLCGVDTHAPFLAQLEAGARAEGVADRVETACCSMLDWAAADGEAVDLVWSEGAVYLVGLEAALARFARILSPGGAVAVSEACSLVDPLPPAVRAAFESEGAPLHSADAVLSRVESCGYEVHGHFVLPASDWRDGYYRPLAERVEELAARDPNDELRAVLDETRAEIALYEEHGDTYSYVFFVASPARG